jgi:hypothetical protein
MSMVDAIVGISVFFGGFCIWLGVRIFNRRERWANDAEMTVILVVLAIMGTFGSALLPLICRALL